MAKINLLRKSTIWDDSIQSYRMVLEITSSEGISKYAFVKQRIRDYTKNTFEDVFAAVCTPAQMEDFDIGSPAEGTAFFRADKVDLVSRNAAYLEDVFDSILRELQKLTEDEEALNVLEADGIFEITADNIEVNQAIVHTDYRLPLTAAPAGLNEVYDDAGTERQRVASQNNNLPGWLNDTTQAGYKFKYNIAKDSPVFLLWPPDADKIGYAHLEVNGITQSSSEVRINSTGIYWRDDRLGYAPWAEDYVNSGDPGENPPVLVLDLIK